MVWSDMSFGRGVDARRWLISMLLGAAFALAPKSANAQFLYAITDGGRIYEVDVAAQTTTLAFTTGLNRLNGMAFYEGGDGGNGQVFYRSGTTQQNGSAGFYMWNRRTNTQTQIAVPTSIVTGGVLPGQSAGASWYGGAYWYVQQNTDRLIKVSVDLSNLNAPSVSRVDTFTNFDGTSVASFSFGDLSISSSGMMYGSASNRFFKIDVSSGSPNTSTYSSSSVTENGLQLGFASDGVTLYGTDASTGAWYTVNTTNGARTPLSFRSLDTAGNVIAFNDISEGSLRSVDAVVQPEPTSLALLLPFGMCAGLLVHRRIRHQGHEPHKRKH